MLYRKDILDELGLSLPMNPTMSEYIEVSKKVYEATGLRDTFVTSCSADNLRFIVRNYGLNLYNEDASALGTLIALGVWQFGSSMLIFLAAIKNIPSSYYEAAIVDGAGPVRRFFSITLPLLTPIIFFNLINQVIGAFQAFNSSYLITKGKPLNTTLYYGVHLYNKAFNQFEMGYGSAMAWFMLLIIAFFTALIFRSSSAWVYYESEGR